MYGEQFHITENVVYFKLQLIYGQTSVVSIIVL